MLQAHELATLSSLSRLALSEIESESLSQELPAILNYVDCLQRVKLEADMVNHLSTEVARVDEISDDAMIRATIINNFPDVLGDALRVPAIFANPKG